MAAKDPYLFSVWLFFGMNEVQACEFRALCPWLEMTGRQYHVDLDELSEAMEDSLLSEGIAYEQVFLPADDGR